MGRANFMRRIAPAGAILAAFVLTASAAGGILEEPRNADLSTTGNHSELVETVPISRQAFTDERVAMSLGPEQLPRFDAGDRLRISAETQVSTTCTSKSARCVGSVYSYNPWVTARLVLSAGPEVADASVPLGEPQQIKCTQRRPQRNHHCTIVFPNFEHVISDPASLPCAAANQCYVNLIVGAWKRRAKPNNVIVTGADRPDGSVVGDKGRLNVVETNVYTPAPSESSANELVNFSLPVNEGKKVKRRVVHWVQVPAPRKGEVLAFDGSYTATIDKLPYNTFISSRVIVADSPLSTDPAGSARSSVQFRGAATESNGFNCTQGRSGFSTPCTAVKAGAIRINKDVAEPLYVNLVASAKPLLYPQQNLKRWQRVKLGAAGGLRVLRFAP
jgi:hypothetical protein